MKSILSDVDRFTRLISIQENDCWYYTGRLDPKGYGIFWWDGKNRLAHRMAHYFFNGVLLPSSILLDHICHDPDMCDGGSECPHRSCVNPDHSVPSTHLENLNSSRRIIRTEALGSWQRAQTHCKNGHEFTTENTHMQYGRYRRCRACSRDFTQKGRDLKRTTLLKPPPARLRALGNAIVPEIAAEVIRAYLDTE